MDMELRRLQRNNFEYILFAENCNSGIEVWVNVLKAEGLKQ
jgi:hypothetical protein